MTGHFIVVESLAMPRSQFEDAKFTIFPADYDADKRLRDLISISHSFWENNVRPEFPPIDNNPVMVRWDAISILDHFAACVPAPLLEYIKQHGLPALDPKKD